MDETNAIDKVKIKANVQVLIEVAEGDDPLLDYCIEEVLDRLYAYLNRTELPSTLNANRIVAKVVAGIFTKYKTEKVTQEPNNAITSITDANGQSISYSENIRTYLNTATDNEIFTGVTALISRYRLARVVL